MLPAAVALVVAIAAAALMGMAIQRGATCMVAAVGEAMTERRYARAQALGEAALWTGGLAALAALAGWYDMAPTRYAVTGWTLVGGVLLGLGAWVNQACVFGAVARIGKGQWAWLATPLGFYLGCLLPVTPPLAQTGSAPALLPWLLAAGFAASLAWRLVGAHRSGGLLEYVWHPHRATLGIALTFVAAMLVAGSWAYTEALAALARPMDMADPQLLLRTVMVGALLLGAIAGGWIDGAISWTRPRAQAVLRCLAGGALMGFGANLVPGSNDGLILVGLPSLLPYAWVTVATMGFVIALAFALSQRFRPAASA